MKREFWNGLKPDENRNNSWISSRTILMQQLTNNIGVKFAFGNVGIKSVKWVFYDDKLVLICFEIELHWLDV